MNKTPHIPIYSNLSPKSRQRAHMLGAALVFGAIVALVSGVLSGPETIKGPSNPGSPKPRPIGTVPGEAVDPRDTWVGGAAKDVARLREDLRDARDHDRQRTAEQERINKDLLDQLRALREAHAAPVSTPSTTALATAAALDAAGGANPAQPGASAAAPGLPSAMSAAGAFPPQPRGANRLPAAGAVGSFPPGTPNQGAALAVDPPAGAGAPPMLVHVAWAGATDTAAERTSGGPAANGAGSATSNAPGSTINIALGTATRRVDTFLPVSFTRAVILGGLAAPTGGQAQSNPVPVILRLADAAVLPNRFRSQVQDCLVIGEGFGDQSAERAYIRTTLLSCVFKNGHVLEVPLKGQVFGEDGMNGVMGKLVTKQGQILTNALLSGIAAGLGQGLATASQVTTTSALGTVSSVPPDTGSILKSSAGTGVGKALDRLSQYYISLAEKTFPVIEVLPGRTVDVVVTQGVALDAALAVGPAAVTTGRESDHAGLLDVLHAAP